MKLSNLTAKLTSTRQFASLKQNAVRILTVATLAGAALAAVAVAPAAQAQRVGFGVVIGGPRYYAPVPPVVVYHGPAYGYPAYPAYNHGYDRWHHDDWGHFHGYDHRGWGHR
jgi:hypothetical protein